MRAEDLVLPDDVRTMIASFVLRLDDEQAQAFHLKMAELDAARGRLH